MAEATKPVEETKKRDWADDDDGQDDEDVEIGGSSVAQIGAARKIDGDDAKDGSSETVVQAKKPLPKAKPRSQRARNIHGDFVVTTINIKEREIVIPKTEEEEEEEEESEEESEEEQKPEAEPEEEVKKGKYRLK